MLNFIVRKTALIWTGSSDSMKAKEALEKVRAAYAAFDPEKWKDFLQFTTSFHNYSWQNKVMIYFQKPNARYLKGYKSWQKIGRQVRKGEKGVTILAPMVYKVEKDGEEQVRVKGFRAVKVFDISQTDGDDEKIPTLIKGLDGTVPEEDFRRVLENAPIPIEIVEGLDVHGCYDYQKKVIYIRKDNDLQMFKTMLHELGHYFHELIGWDDESREQMEFIAESAACAVAGVYGIDTGDYSIPYVKSWLDDFKQFEVLQKKLEKVIQKTLAVCGISEAA